MDQNKLTETLAVNTGNMIASLNLQVATLQTENTALKDENKQLKIEIDKYKLMTKGKVVKMNESSDPNTANKQIDKHSK